MICAAIEVAGGSRGAAMEAIAEKIRTNTRAVLRQAREDGVPLRRAAMEMARARVEEALGYRRRF